MSRNESIHVRFESKLSVDTFLVEFDLDEVVGVRSDDEVHFSPIYHDHFLDVVDHIWQLLPVNLIDTLVISTWLKISMENLVFVQPFCFENFVVSHFVGVIGTQEWHHVVGFGFWRQKAVRVLPNKGIGP